MISRIEARLAELKLTARAASLQVSDSPDLFRIILTGRSRNPRRDTLRKAAQALKVSEHWLLTGEGEMGEPPREPAPEPEVAHARRQSGGIRAFALDVPVMGTAAGSIIADKIEGFEIADPIEYVRRPPALTTARDLYAIYVTGESMSPKHEPGELRFVHPHREPLIGDTVIVQTRRHEADPGQAYIKILKRRTGDRVVLEQINPQALMTIPRQFIVAIHRVMTVNDLFGV